MMLNAHFTLTVLVSTLGLFFIGGCTTTRVLAPDNGAESNARMTIDEAKRQTEGAQATLSLRRGQQFQGTMVRLSKDSATIAIEEPEPHDTSFSLRQIFTIRTRDHALGAIEGVLLGGLSGYLLGVAANALKTPRGDMMQGFGTFLSTSACALGGIVIGAVDGHVRIIEIPEDTGQAEAHRPQSEIFFKD